MRTLLTNVRIIDVASGVIYEDGLLTLEHVNPVAAPDLIGYCGDIHVKEAEFYKKVTEEDKIVDMKGATVIPGLVDAEAGFIEDTEDESMRALLAYRHAGEALIRGMLVAGCPAEKKSTAEALKKITDEYILWGPKIIVRENYSDTEEFAVLRGLPKKDSEKEKEEYIGRAKKIRASGKKPVIATGMIPGENQREELPLVEAAELLTEAGFTSMEALRAVTVNPGIYLGIDKENEHLKTGYEGDIVAVMGKPDEDISALRQMVMVARGGRLTWSRVKDFELTRFMLLPPGYTL